MEHDYTLHTAIALATQHLTTYATRKLAKREEAWHSLPPTVEQLDFIRRYANEVLVDVQTMGIASEIIDNIIANWNVGKVTRALWYANELNTYHDIDLIGIA
jgi:hypothetical protein